MVKSPCYTLTWINKLAEIPQAEWDALAMPLNTPFLEWEWLNNMETSHSTTARTGWLPNHLVVWRDSQRDSKAARQLVAVAPLYIKGHSQGEFVFDHQWADLASRMGVEYYPKMLGMSPFTPAEGYRFLIAPDVDEDEITALMVEAIDRFCIQNNISGCNFLYVDPQWRGVMERHGFRRWLHHSFIWSNQNFETFEDYLGSFNANQRRNIKRERKAVAQTGLRIEPLTGDRLSKALMSKVYDFYSDTCDKFGWWGSKYLTRRFFEQLYPNYSHRVVMFAVYGEGDSADPIGMSFCLTKGERLYGRYWGAFQDFENLHFDTCYYTPIEWAIRHKIQLFDPGAGGRHKKRRGFPATPNHSLHRFYDPHLSQILCTYIDEVNRMEQREMDAINEGLPFKNLD